MSSGFNDRFTAPDHSVFKVVFYPDRIFHAAYLNATRSPRYRYNVREVHEKVDITALKGEVFLDGTFLCNFLRIEYRASRLVELARQRGRLLGPRIGGWIKLLHDDPAKAAEATIELEYCRWTDAYQVEIWATIDAPPGQRHDFSVLDQMGRRGAITRFEALVPALNDIGKLRRLDVAFRESSPEVPIPDPLERPEWDNNYMRSHEEPRSPEPSSPENTVLDLNYRVDFQRSYFVDARAIEPVRYVNAMMDPGRPDASPDNIIEMRWLLQRELGGSLVFFHEVTVPPGKIEGTHQHAGSEECYYIVSGTGVTYVGVGDDPATDPYPTVDQPIYSLPNRLCKEVPIRPGHVVFAKSGGLHGIRNTGTEPLRFVSFLYHTR